MAQESWVASPYRRILVAIDNSKYSDAAVRTVAALAQPQGAAIVGLHVYAALLHERRFLQMEPGLPGNYSDTDLQHQRSVHESLISTGLRLISQSYLDHACALCEEAGVAFEGRVAQGKNYEEIIREVRTGAYDLVALGALGLGARRRSVIGSVCERVLRIAPGDVLVARSGYQKPRGIMVALDGSPNSYQALGSALVLGAALEQQVEVVTVYDSQFHIVAFQRLTRVLSSEAAALFRFKEQQQLHTAVIDKGLEKLYRGYLDQAEELAAARGQQVRTSLLSGKPFQSILGHVEKRQPWLLVAGRFGQQGGELADIGSITENLVRLAPCSTLVVRGALDPPQSPDHIPGARLPWTPEAEDRLRTVSKFARSIVREAVEQYAHQRGYGEVTLEVMARARRDIGW